MNVSEFLNGLQDGGYWRNICGCGAKYDDIHARGMCPECYKEELENIRSRVAWAKETARRDRAKAGKMAENSPSWAMR